MNNVPEFIALAKKYPGKLSFGSGGTGTLFHLAAEYFKSMTKTNLFHVPYKGSVPALQDVMGGHIDFLFDNIGSNIPHVRSGGVKGLAVTSPSAHRPCRIFPPSRELGYPDYDVSQWYGLFAPPKTSPEIVNRLQAEVSKALAAKDVAERLYTMGNGGVGTQPGRIHKDPARRARAMESRDPGERTGLAVSVTDNNHRGVPMSKLEDIESPVPGGNAQMEWVSDVMAEMIRRLDLKYVAMNPGASYRGLHDSLVNYLGNRNPQMLLTLHEEHAVSIAHGYARVTEQPMGCLLHSNVGLMHGLMAIFNAWINRAPIVMFGATGPVDADIRRPWVDWVHTAQDQGALLRNYTKWDDQPTSVPALCESFLRAMQLACTPPKGPTYVCLDAGLQELSLKGPVEFPDPSRFKPGPPPAPSQDTLEEMARLLTGASRPLLLVGRVSRKVEDWDRRVRLAEALGAKVISELRAGAGFPTEHPLHVYPPRYTPSKETLELMRSADVILALDSFDLGGWFKLMNVKGGPKATVIHCSVDSYVHNGWSKDHLALPAVDLRVLADPDAAVRLLLPLIERSVQAKPKKWEGFKAAAIGAGACQ